jgi:N-acetylglucosaminyldiphosphoundecaprenol N-acetyl-beta-D-mannosaminyltransferase
MVGESVSDAEIVFPERRFMGVRVHAATMAQVVERCERVAETGERLMLGVVNAAKIVNMHQDEALRDSVQNADLVLADGMAVVWASRILREPLPERVPGIDLFEDLLALADRREFSVFFLGATEEVLSDMIQIVKRRFPRLRIAGWRNGYFSDDEAEAVAREIDAARPQFLFVGMGTPKKEIFLARWGPRMDVCVCHGVGGAFDVLGGKVERAPQVMQRIGLEWLYRVLQEPRRMWRRYLVTNTYFILMLFREWLRTAAWSRNREDA